MLVVVCAVPALANAPATNGGNQRPNSHVPSLSVDFAPYQKPVSASDAYFIAVSAPFEPLESLTQTPPASPKSPPDEREVIKAYIRTLWGDKADLAIKVFTCESNLHQESINWGDAKITGMPSQGIAQINRPLNPKLLEWKYNLDVAYNDYYLTRGWTPWTCATKLGIK